MLKRRLKQQIQKVAHQKNGVIKNRDDNISAQREQLDKYKELVEDMIAVAYNIAMDEPEGQGGRAWRIYVALVGTRNAYRNAYFKP